MSLKFAILTSLTEREGSGIELARRFDKSIGYFWPATHQQIYRELDRLGTAGLIRELPLEGATPSRGNPRRFGVTPEGRVRLEEWARELGTPEPVKSAMAVRLRAAAATGTAHEVRYSLESEREQRRANLDRYRQIEERDFADVDPSDTLHALQHQILKLGIQVEQAWVGWCDETLALLSAS